MSSVARHSQHELQQRVNKVSRRARWLMFAGGVAMTGVVVMGVVVTLGLVDYIFRIEDLGVRLICSLAMWATVAAGVFFFIRPAFSRRFEPRYIARLIEQRYPQLGDRLSSTLEFLYEAEDDPKAGSPSLRRAVVAETTSIAADLNFSEVLRSGLKWWIFGALMLIGVITAAAFTVDGFAASTALQRLAAPWQPRPWPRRTNLVVIEAPAIVAKGQSWRVKVRDQNDRLPADAMFEMEPLAGKQGRTEAMPMTVLQDRLEFQVAPVNRSFRFRVFGDDDHSMDWRLVEVVEPAQTKSLRISVMPPPYLPAVPASEQDGAIRALIGSTIRITGSATKPAVRVAATIRQGKTTSTTVGKLTGNRFSIPRASAAPIPISADGQVSITLTDAQDVTSNTTLEIIATPDLPPSVTLLEPRGAQFVTRQAIVPIEASVKEDVGLDLVALVYRKPGTANDEMISITPTEGSAKRPEPTVIQESSSNHSIAWDLAELPDLAEGESITIRIRAVDVASQIGESAPLRLSIVSDADVLDRIGQQQSLILNQLNQALVKQRMVKGLIADLMIQFNDVGEFGDNELQQLQNSELNQRQINDQLSGPTRGALRQIETLLDRVEQNRLNAPLLRRRLTELADGLRSLADGPLPTISQQLLAGVKTGRAQLAEHDERRAPVSPELRDLTQSSAADQDEVIRRLETLVGDLAQWEDYRLFGREMRRILADQQAITAEVAAERPRLLTRDPDDWSPQELADLRKLALRQGDLAIRFEKLQVRMTNTRDELTESQPVAAEAITDAIDAADRHAINGRLREASRLLGVRQFGAASETQVKIEAGLLEVIDALSNRYEHDLTRQGDKLKAAAADIGLLAKQQANLRDRISKAAANPNEQQRKRELKKLAAEQKRLADETKQLGRRLERLDAKQAATAAKNATDNMQQASDAGEQGNGDASQQKAADAARDLEDVARKIESRQQQAEKDLFDEQMARLQGAIEALVNRQQAVHEELTRLAGLIDELGKLSVAQQASAGVLARSQRLISGESADLAEKIAAAKAFALALRGARREMDRVASRLDALDLSPATERAALSALERLQQIADALKKEDSSGESDPGAGGESNPNQPAPEGDSIQRLSELKLMRTMQTEINQRTRDLDTAQVEQGGQFSPEQVEQRAELVDEQGQLARLMLEMVESFADNPAGDPDALPDINQDTNNNEPDEIESTVKRLLETDESRFDEPQPQP